jgi:L-ribulose-5-phosphate 3-epimerase UlaE
MSQFENTDDSPLWSNKKKISQIPFRVTSVSYSKQGRFNDVMRGKNENICSYLLMFFNESPLGNG